MRLHNDCGTCKTLTSVRVEKIFIDPIPATSKIEPSTIFTERLPGGL